jgi:hypothetical protein
LAYASLQTSIRITTRKTRKRIRNKKDHHSKKSRKQAKDKDKEYDAIRHKKDHDSKRR